MLEAWAHPTWLFFHSLAEKINEDFLKKNTLDVLNMIKNICVNLPCPTCSEHAKNYMKHITPDHINSRDKIRLMFLNFHNSVNARTGKQTFSAGGLVKYRLGRFDIIYVHFITSFTKKFNSTLLAGRFSRNSKRKQLGNNLNAWFKRYWEFFNI